MKLGLLKELSCHHASKAVFAIEEDSGKLKSRAPQSDLHAVLEVDVVVFKYTKFNREATVDLVGDNICAMFIRWALGRSWMGF